MSWIAITNIDNIPTREGRGVLVGDRDIAIFNMGDRFLAIDNRCPHRGGPLCDGIVSGDTVVCPLHAWKIGLETGEVVKPEVSVKVETYAVDIRERIVHVWLPAEEAEFRECA